MKKLVGMFLAGVMVVIPFAATVYVIWLIGSWLDGIGHQVLPENLRFYGLGVLVVIVGIFVVGVLTHFWLFKWMLRLFEKLFGHQAEESGS